jgi:hypothetical protein
MAYGVYIAAVDSSEIEKLRTDAKSGIRTRAIVGITHLVVTWTKEKDLRECLYQIVDEGPVLADRFWHPLRSPIMHGPADVPLLERALRPRNRTMCNQRTCSETRSRRFWIC